MIIEEKLLNIKKSKLTIFEIQDILNIYNYDELYKTINNLVNSKVLIPVKTSGLNGRKPSLYKRYWVKQMDYDNVKHEIKLLSYHFNHEGYLNNPEKYIKDKDIIYDLDNYFKYKINDLETPSSVNERSFKIFGHEKTLSSTRCKHILRYNDIDYKTLNCYDTPEPLFDYIYEDKDNMNVLIIENKDTWYTIRKILREDNNNILKGLEIHAIIYGEGNKITSKRNSLSNYNDEVLKSSKNTYYYFGDLDYMGIGIYENLANANKDLDIILAAFLYKDMLINAQDITLPNCEKNQLKIDIECFLQNFNEKEKENIIKILDSGKYIPQELFDYNYFKSNLK